MLFLVIDPTGHQEPVGLHQIITLEVLLQIDHTDPHSLVLIRIEEVLPLECDLHQITLHIEQVFQEHLLTEDHLHLVLPEVIVALIAPQDHQGLQVIIEALVVHPDPLEMFVAQEVLPDPQVAFVVQEVPGPQVAFVAQEVPQDLLVAGLVEVVGLAEEDNSSN